VFPLKDDISTRTTPVVTIALIVANVTVFLLGIRNGGSIFGGPDAQTVVHYGVIPYELTHPGKECEIAPQLGAILCEGRDGVRVFDTPPTWLTLFSSMFMHGGLFHIAGNMLFLWVFGDNVEHRVGHAVFLVFYVVAGLIATVAQVLVSIDSYIPTLGASGAIAGVLGAYLVLFPTNRVLVFLFRGVVPVPAIVAIGMWAALQVLAGFGAPGEGGGVAYTAHIAGFLAGAAAGLAFRAIFNEPRRPRGMAASALG
jgi:rhomboid family protein